MFARHLAFSLVMALPLGEVAAAPAPAPCAEEPRARELLARDANDPVAHSLLARCALDQAKTAPPAGASPGSLPRWDPKMLRRAADEAGIALKLAPRNAAAAAVRLEALARIGDYAGMEAVIKGAEPEAFDAATHRALAGGLSLLPPRGDGEEALNIVDAWAARFPHDEEARRGAAALWMSAGALDRAERELAAWAAEPHGPGRFRLARAQVEVLLGRPEKAEAVLAESVDASAVPAQDAGPAAELADLVAGALRRAGAKPRLERLASDVPARGAASRDLAKALLVEGAGAKPQLSGTAAQLIEKRAFVEAALALQARRAAGEWGHAEQLSLSELWHRMREWLREAGTLRPMATEVDRAGRTTTGMTAGDFHFHIGRALYHGHDYAGAADEYDRSGKAGKADPELFFHIAKNLGAQKKFDESRAWMKRAADWKAPAAHADKARKALQAPEPPPSPAAPR